MNEPTGLAAIFGDMNAALGLQKLYVAGSAGAAQAVEMPMVSTQSFDIGFRGSAVERLPRDNFEAMMMYGLPVEHRLEHRQPPGPLMPAFPEDNEPTLERINRPLPDAATLIIDPLAIYGAR